MAAFGRCLWQVRTEEAGSLEWLVRGKLFIGDKYLQKLAESMIAVEACARAVQSLSDNYRFRKKPTRFWEHSD
ncbi:hypothetical protein D3C71_568550 [compost metagenome]